MSEDEGGAERPRYAKIRVRHTPDGRGLEVDYVRYVAPSAREILISRLVLFLVWLVIVVTFAYGKSLLGILLSAGAVTLVLIAMMAMTRFDQRANEWNHFVWGLQKTYSAALRKRLQPKDVEP